jgi:hypothetical protein
MLEVLQPLGIDCIMIPLVFRQKPVHRPCALAYKHRTYADMVLLEDAIIFRDAPLHL